jgi:hypothetical protein
MHCECVGFNVLNVDIRSATVTIAVIRALIRFVAVDVFREVILPVSNVLYVVLHGIGIS